MEAGFEVEPTRLQEVGSSLLEIRRAQRERLHGIGRCHGLLILRTNPADDIAPVMEACEADRADIEATGKRLAYGILDVACGDAPCPSGLPIDVLPGRGPGWLQAVRGWLGRAHTDMTDVAA